MRINHTGKPPRTDRGSISVSAECYAKIERAAAIAGMSIGAFVDDRITQYLNRKGQP